MEICYQDQAHGIVKNGTAPARPAPPYSRGLPLSAVLFVVGGRVRWMATLSSRRGDTAAELWPASSNRPSSLGSLMASSLALVSGHRLWPRLWPSSLALVSGPRLWPSSRPSPGSGRRLPTRRCHDAGVARASRPWGHSRRASRISETDYGAAETRKVARPAEVVAFVVARELQIVSASQARPANHRDRSLMQAGHAVVATARTTM